MECVWFDLYSAEERLQLRLADPLGFLHIPLQLRSKPIHSFWRAVSFQIVRTAASRGHQSWLSVIFYDISQIDHGIKRTITACKAKYCYYEIPPINMKLFKLINEEKTHLKIINQQASSFNFRVSSELFHVQTIVFFSVSMERMWCGCSLFFRGRNECCVNRHIRHWLITYLLQFTATAFSNWNQEHLLRPSHVFAAKRGAEEDIIMKIWI